MVLTLRYFHCFQYDDGARRDAGPRENSKSAFCVYKIIVFEVRIFCMLIDWRNWIHNNYYLNAVK